MNKRTIDVALRWASERGWNQSRLAKLLDKSPADVTNWKARGLPVEMDRPIAELFSRSVEELYGNAQHARSELALATVAERYVTVEDVELIWVKLNPERQRRLLANAWDFLKSQESEVPSANNPFVRIPAPSRSAVARTRADDKNHLQKGKI